jgi:hypothetical protein
MKIHADKIDGVHPHALGIRGIRCLLAAVPESWIADLKGVRLTNSLESSPRAFFSRHDHILVVHARGCTTRQALELILFELAGVHFGYATRHWHTLSAREKSHLQKIVEPLIEELVPVVTPSKKRFIEIPTPAFRRVV